MQRIPGDSLGFGRGTTLGGGLAVTLTLALAGGASADILHVDAGAALGGDGQSWTTAFAHLADAIDAANQTPEPDEIRIAGGIYRPDSSDSVPGGSGDRDLVFEVLESMTLLGGFAGQGAPDPDVRDLDGTPTIIDADLDGDDDLDDPSTRSDNARALLVAVLGDEQSLVLDGLSFRNAESGPFTGIGHGAVGVFGGHVTARDCRFRWNRAVNVTFPDTALGGGIRGEGASMEIIDSEFLENEAALGGAIYSRFGLGLIVRGTTIRGNRALSSGGAIRQILGDDLIIDDCVIEDNSGEVGGALAILDTSGDVLITGSRFVGNRAEGGAAAGIIAPSPGTPDRTFLIDECVVEANESLLTVAGFGLLLTPDREPVLVRNTIFRANVGASIGGALGGGGNRIDLVNCVFVGNRADLFSAVRMPDEGGNVINCTFADNSDLAIKTSTARFRNSIIWKCGDTPFVLESGEPASSVDIDQSIVEGGWPGNGIIDADPLFAQLGTGDVRLTPGSPALDEGDTSELPPGLRLDLAGNPRVQGSAVDLGAYEGVVPAGPPANSYPDIDSGEAVIAGLDGPDFDPLSGPSFLFINESDVENAELLISELTASDFPPAPGGTPVGIARQVETDVPDGELRLLLLLPFDAADLEAAGGPDADPFRMNLARRDDQTNAWALAASANTVPTAVPGIQTALADRTVDVGTSTVNFSSDFGRWGIWWSPSEQRGVVWAATNRIGTYAVVLNDCPADAAQPPDGVVDLGDLLEVLGSFDRGAGPWDVDGDGSVGITDLTGILAAWGICP